MSGHYAGQRIALLTQHGKEQVITPVLDPALACRIERVEGFDTDQLGTFTRDMPRFGTQLDAARRKARIGMVFVETDLRACANRERMRRLGEAAPDLLRRLQSSCPVWGLPG